MYCEECEKVVCRSCHQVGKKDHKTVPLEEKTTEEQEKSQVLPPKVQEAVTSSGQEKNSIRIVLGICQEHCLQGN